MDENLFMIDTQIYTINQSLNPVKMDQADFGARNRGELQGVVTRIASMGRRYGAQDFTLERLSTIDPDRPRVKFHDEGVRIYYPLRESSIHEMENTIKFFEFIFREYVDFFWTWLVVYTCRNHRRLPFIILTGKRSIGKTTVMNFVSSLFSPKLSIIRRDLPENFHDHRTKKFLGLDEFDGSQKELYNILKFYQGSTHLPVNLKYLPEFQVENNLNIIVASNDPQPVYFESTEFPKSEMENPWFILDLSHITSDKFPLTRDEVRRVVEGAPNFARAFLIPRYNKLESDGVIGSARFTIPCPITPDQQFMFKESVSDLTYFAERVLCEVLSQRKGEHAITATMISEVIEERRIDNPRRFSVNQVRKHLIHCEHVARTRTITCQTTSGKGYKILRMPSLWEEYGGKTSEHSDTPF